MDQYEFEQHLDGITKRWGTTPIGRFVKNAFGLKEKVVLPSCYWWYIDWLVMNKRVNIKAYIIDCDKERGDMPLSLNLMRWLYQDMIERREDDEELPDYIDFV